jgi:hypothetical protein
MTIEFRFRKVGLALAVLACALAPTPRVAAAPQESSSLGTRQLWNVQLAGKQTKVEKTAGNNTTKRLKQARYEADKGEPAPLREDDAIVGITIWALRPSNPADDKSAVLTVAENGGSRTYAPIRVAAGKPLAVGQRVRLSIEAPREGFLYVINREQYADGTYSEPYLIFPTLRTRGGKNDVTAGRVIEIPDQEDNPPYFTLRPRREGQTAEVLIVLVTPEPLKDVKIGRNALKLSQEQFASWESMWGVEAERFELAGGVGRPWTRVEKEAGLGSRLLVQDEPMPQTLYRVPVKPGNPVMLTVPLEIRR